MRDARYRHSPVRKMRGLMREGLQRSARRELSSEEERDERDEQQDDEEDAQATPAQRFPAGEIQVVASLPASRMMAPLVSRRPPMLARSTAMSAGGTALDTLVAPARMNASAICPFLDEHDGDGSAHGVPRRRLSLRRIRREPGPGARVECGVPPEQSPFNRNGNRMSRGGAENAEDRERSCREAGWRRTPGADPSTALGMTRRSRTAQPRPASPRRRARPAPADRELAHPQGHAVVGARLDEIESLADVGHHGGRVADARLRSRIGRAGDLPLGLEQADDAHFVVELEVRHLPNRTLRVSLSCPVGTERCRRAPGGGRAASGVRTTSGGAPRRDRPPPWRRPPRASRR